MVSAVVTIPGALRIMGRHRVEATFCAYGIKVRAALPDAEMLEAVAVGLPRGWTVTTDRLASSDEAAARLVVVREPSRYLIRDGGGAESHYADPGMAVRMLSRILQRTVTAGIQDRICIAGSVVTHRGRAIMLPARALAGTTTLVRALVLGGAELHSEEFAMIGRDGRLVSDLSAVAGAGDRPVPLGLVALAVYQPGTVWAPRQMTQAEGVAALMAFATAASKRPAETLAALGLALDQVVVLEGQRGDAAEAAVALLDAAAH